MNIIELTKSIFSLSDNDFEKLKEKLSVLEINIDKNILSEGRNSKEERLDYILFGLKENGFGKDGYFIKNNVKLLYYNSKYKELYVSYKLIWSVFEKEFNMEYDEIKKFITEYVVDTLQIEVKYTGRGYLATVLVL